MIILAPMTLNLLDQKIGKLDSCDDVVNDRKNKKVTAREAMNYMYRMYLHTKKINQRLLSFIYYNNIKGENMEKIEQLQKIIDESNNIVFFGGAGVSTASGIKDFRGKNGIYKEIREKKPEYLLSVRCFFQEQDLFFNFYKEKMNCLNIKPNIVHLYLADLEEKGKLKAIVTQNIDGLHQKAGSKNVLEIHGSIYENYCMECKKRYNAEFVFNSDGIPRCECGGIIKPNVVLYGEMLPESYSLARSYIYQAETLIVAGTSLTVEPASSLINSFNGKNLIIINDEETAYDDLATLVIHDDLKNVFTNLH